MLSQTLFRLGRLAARRPWAVIASWLVLAVLVGLFLGLPIALLYSLVLDHFIEGFTVVGGAGQ